jgi:hypothetical protein
VNGLGLLAVLFVWWLVGVPLSFIPQASSYVSLFGVRAIPFQAVLAAALMIGWYYGPGLVEKEMPAQRYVRCDRLDAFGMIGMVNVRTQGWARDKASCAKAELPKSAFGMQLFPMSAAQMPQMLPYAPQFQAVPFRMPPPQPLQQFQAPPVQPLPPQPYPPRR